MDFSLKTFGDAFIEPNKNYDYPLYAFILATESDKNIFPTLFSSYKEIHILTGKDMLIFGPCVDLHNPESSEYFTEYLADSF